MRPISCCCLWSLPGCRYGPFRGGLDRVRKGALISVSGKHCYSNIFAMSAFIAPLLRCAALVPER